GVYVGSEVSIYYDPMISKFAVYGRDRSEAVERMRRALREYQIVGLRTTIPFFRLVMDDQEFIAGRLDTGFIERFFERTEKGKADQESEPMQRDLSIMSAAFQKAKRLANVRKNLTTYANKNKRASHTVRPFHTQQIAELSQLLT